MVGAALYPARLLRHMCWICLATPILIETGFRKEDSRNRSELMHLALR